jgi:hypothetical protein
MLGLQLQMHIWSTYTYKIHIILSKMLFSCNHMVIQNTATLTNMWVCKPYSHTLASLKIGSRQWGCASHINTMSCKHANRTSWNETLNHFVLKEKITFLAFLPTFCILIQIYLWTMYCFMEMNFFSYLINLTYILSVWRTPWQC